ncbi:MAG: nitrile hydratase accessory protein [Panacagrimonas sp.]|nr:nitrile hydratase accessory protein [Panacagrimonas sp.]MCC2656378.1 nitrile hydratase accessory protein [Panacagrimonas sp.]
MSAPATIVDVPPVDSIPRDLEGPVFREPWEAQAFALVVQLHREGVFTWTEWADALSAEIAAVKRRHRLLPPLADRAGAPARAQGHRR